MPKQAPPPDFSSLLEEYGETKDKRVKCMVCDSMYRELIDEMQRRGGGGPSISRFLKRRLDLDMGVSVLVRHKNTHLDAGAK